MTTFAYDRTARVPLPVMKVVLSDPASRASAEVSPMVDTGFDGGLLVPLDQYLGLGLQDFEEPGGTFVARSASGLTVSLRSSRGIAAVGGGRFRCSVYTSPLLLRPLLGRELLS
ncbi:MAG: hypothetical protein LYZ70_05090, partial [Nitrososphaerales archaeon]|nr:hypothetical protein [Nitrososphaerales archaeon]